MILYFVLKTKNFYFSYSLGSIPVYYREIYKLCSPNGDTIHRDVFQTLLSQSKLSGPILRMIWDLTGPPQGVVTRINFYKTLALLAWAQQGKDPSDKLFDNFNGKGNFARKCFRLKLIINLY